MESQARLVAESVRRRDEPRDIVDLVDNRVLFGDDHPYGRPARGTVGSLNAVTTDDLRAFYAQHFSNGGGVALDIDWRDAAIATVERYASRALAFSPILDGRPDRLAVGA